jgi:hypothetical protein
MTGWPVVNGLEVQIRKATAWINAHRRMAARFSRMTLPTSEYPGAIKSDEPDFSTRL